MEQQRLMLTAISFLAVEARASALHYLPEYDMIVFQLKTAWFYVVKKNNYT
jgi:hypothetical protein